MKIHILIFIFLVSLLASCDQEHTVEMPNIIFLLTDDQRFDALGAMGNEVIQTPNLDRLAKEGMMFSNSFVTTSICCTSRASIFSGQYARRHDINDFVTSFSDSAWSECYPALLKEAGYHTGFIGKFGVGVEEDMPSATFDYWQGFGGWGHYENEDDEGNFIHLTRKIGNQAIEYLQIAESVDRPFCLSISFKAPHCQDGDPRQFIVDSAFMKVLKDVTIPDEPLNKDEYYMMFSEKFRERNEARHRWNIRFSTPEIYQEMVKNYYRLIYGVDDVVRRIREELDARGLAQNTIIIFTSDNGFYLGEYGLAGKWYGHKESIRVPMLVYDPRTGTRNLNLDQMVLNIDIAPTILDLAGIAIPEKMQGKSLVPLMKNPDVQWRNEFFYEHQFIRASWGHKPYIPGVEGVVTKNTKYMKYLHGGDTVVYEELFDKKFGPAELKNLVEDSEYLIIKEELKYKLEKFKIDLQ
jgi:arylsulfatase A-like enzyme